MKTRPAKAIRCCFAAMMTLLFASCGSRTLVLPENVDPGWKLAESAARRGIYNGPGKIEIRFEELSSGANAFEKAQQWRPIRGTIAFHKDRYFFLASGADQETLNRFVAAFEKSLVLK